MIMALRQAIFDSFGYARRTPNGAMGHQSRVTVMVPLSTVSFQERFVNLLDDIPLDSNVDIYLFGDDITKAIGENLHRELIRHQQRHLYLSRNTFMSHGDIKRE